MGKEVADGESLIENFISSYVVGHSLDERTEKAYRMDLELFYVWEEQEQAKAGAPERQFALNNGCVMATGLENSLENGQKDSLESRMDAYIDYLKAEKKLSFSTLYRKNRVLGYYLSYLARQGIIPGYRKLKAVTKADIDKEKKQDEAQSLQGLLSRKEADAFFAAMDREYEQLDSEFRRRVCLRDMVMMELIFYHKIEISELLRMEARDYCQETGTLTIRRKRGGDRIVQLYSQELLRKMGLWLDERGAFLHKEEYFGRMFLSKFGKPLSMEMFIQIFDKYRRLAGIEKKLTPKDLKESSMKSYARELMMERCSWDSLNREKQ